MKPQKPKEINTSKEMLLNVISVGPQGVCVQSATNTIEELIKILKQLLNEDEIKSYLNLLHQQEINNADYVG